MQNEKKNNHNTRALNNFMSGLEPDFIVKTIEEVFFGFVQTEDYTDITAREKDGIVHCYRNIIKFINGISVDAPKALNDFLYLIEPKQAKQTLETMLTTYMLTDNFCDSPKGTREVISFETNSVIGFFSELMKNK